uniref:Uncharacterized protein n=1 Tax=Manihot esculenta TaxID=3983 RepID=A0A2C9VDH5_MANES
MGRLGARRLAIILIITILAFIGNALAEAEGERKNKKQDDYVNIQFICCIKLWGFIAVGSCC